MQRDDDDWIVTTPQSDRRFAASKWLFLWICSLLLLPMLLSVLSARLAPPNIAATAATIFFDAAVILLVGALPFLAMILWNLLQLARQSFWGLAIIIIGLGVMLPGFALYEVIATFWDRSAQSSFITTLAVLVFGGGLAIVSLGMLVICAWAIWRSVQLLLGLRSARSGD